MTDSLILPKSMSSSYQNFRFAPGRVSHGLVFISGQIGTTKEGSIPELPEKEFELVCEHILTVLQEADCTFKDVIDITSYHTDLNQDLDAFMKVKNTLFSEPYPTWTAVGTTALAVPNARVEVKVVASKD